jgi:hypothetical protein
MNGSPIMLGNAQKTLARNLNGEALRGVPREISAMVPANDNIPPSRRVIWPETIWSDLLTTWLCPPALALIAILAGCFLAWGLS